jgi:hypothetical protein
MSGREELLNSLRGIGVFRSLCGAIEEMRSHGRAEREDALYVCRG